MVEQKTKWGNVVLKRLHAVWDKEIVIRIRIAKMILFVEVKVMVKASTAAMHFLKTLNAAEIQVTDTKYTKFLGKKKNVTLTIIIFLFAFLCYFRSRDNSYRSNKCPTSNSVFIIFTRYVATTFFSQKSFTGIHDLIIYFQAKINLNTNNLFCFVVSYSKPSNRGRCCVSPGVPHRRCECVKAKSDCKTTCDSDESCRGYTVSSHKLSCQTATTSNCPSHCNLYESGGTGSLDPSAVCGIGAFTGCYVKEPTS